MTKEDKKAMKIREDTRNSNYNLLTVASVIILGFFQAFQNEDLHFKLQIQILFLSILGILFLINFKTKFLNSLLDIQKISYSLLLLLVLIVSSSTLLELSKGGGYYELIHIVSAFLLITTIVITGIFVFIPLPSLMITLILVEIVELNNTSYAKKIKEIISINSNFYFVHIVLGLTFVIVSKTLTDPNILPYFGWGFLFTGIALFIVNVFTK